MSQEDAEYLVSIGRSCWVPDLTVVRYCRTSKPNRLYKYNLLGGCKLCPECLTRGPQK